MNPGKRWRKESSIYWALMRSLEHTAECQKTIVRRSLSPPRIKLLIMLRLFSPWLASFDQHFRDLQCRWNRRGLTETFRCGFGLVFYAKSPSGDAGGTDVSGTG